MMQTLLEAFNAGDRRAAHDAGRDVRRVPLEAAVDELGWGTEAGMLEAFADGYRARMRELR